METGISSPKPANGEDTENSPNPKKQQKQNENKYPGLSFILFVKSLPGSSNPDSWFECVLCTPDHRMAPKEMTVHLRSYNHLHNLMEVECPSSLPKFTDNSNTHAMLKCILEHESMKGPPQSMMAAYPENVATKRNEVTGLIQSLKLTGSSDPITLQALKNDEWEKDDKQVKIKVEKASPPGNYEWENNDEAAELPKSTGNFNWEDDTDQKGQEVHQESKEAKTEHENKGKLKEVKKSDDTTKDEEEINFADGEDSENISEDLTSEKVNEESGDDDKEYEFEDEKSKSSEDPEKDVESYGHLLEKDENMQRPTSAIDFSNFEMFQKGFQGKQFIMSIFESLKTFTRNQLKFSHDHVYFIPIERSYTEKFLEKNPKGMGKRLRKEEVEFLKNNVNNLYLDHDVLSYCHKPILPVWKLAVFCKQFHESLHHPNTITLFEIISRECFVFPDKTLEVVESVTENCRICASSSEELIKAHSFKVLEAYNEWPNKREMKALNFTGVTNMSYSRNPTKIVIISDERDETLKSLSLNDVTIRICPGLNLENAFDFISCDSNFGQGVLFVVLSGAFTFVRWEVDADCMKKHCREPLLLPSVIQLRENDLYTFAVNAARNLHQSVMLNSPKDDVIFGHVLPIALNSNANFLAIRHHKICGHKSQHPLLTHPQKESYVSLNIAMLNYNGWTDRFAAELGYHPWNLSAGFFAEVIQFKKKIHKFNLGKLREDGIHFTSITQELRCSMVKDLCRETLEKLHSKEKNGLLKNFVSMTNPLVTRTVTGQRFDKILIFCEPDSKIFLNQFSSSQVLVTDTDIGPNTINSLCTQFNLKDVNTLWVFTSSIRPIAQKLCFEGCSHFKCQMQLPFLAPRNEMAASPQGAAKGINEVMNNVRTLVTMARKLVGAKCVAIVAPIFPVTMVNADLLMHDNVHRLFKKVPQVFVSNNSALKALLPLYCLFHERTMELAKELFMSQGLYPSALIDFKPRIKGVFRTLGTKQTHFPFMPPEWEQMMRNLIYMGLNGVPVFIPPTPEDSFLGPFLTPDLLDKFKKQSGNLRFSRVVLIASKDLNSILESFTCPLLQVINMEVDDPQEEINAAIEKIQALPNKTLCIYLGDFSVIMDSISSKTSCQLNHCLSSIDCYTLKTNTKYQGLTVHKMVEEVVKSIHSRLTVLSDALNGSSFFIVAPLCPVRGFCLEGYPSNLHVRLHTLTSKQRSFEFLDGEETEWVVVCETLDKLWFFLMESFKPNIGAPYRVILKYEVWKEKTLSFVQQPPTEDFPKLSAWKSTLVAFIDMCLKMRKDGKLVEKKPPSIEAPPAPPKILLSVVGQSCSSGSAPEKSVPSLCPPPLPPVAMRPPFAFSEPRMGPVQRPPGPGSINFPPGPGSLRGPPPPVSSLSGPPPVPMGGPHVPISAPPGPMGGMPGPMDGPPGTLVGPPRPMVGPPIPMGGPPIPMGGPPIPMGGPPIPMGGPPIPMGGPPRGPMGGLPGTMGGPPGPMSGPPPSSPMAVPPGPLGPPPRGPMPGPPPGPPMSGLFAINFSQPPPMDSQGGFYPSTGPPSTLSSASGASTCTSSSINFPGPQTYSYPVPSLSSVESSLKTDFIEKPKVITKAPVKFNVPKVVDTSDVKVNESDSKDFRILIGKIASSITDLDLNMILSLIGDFIIFERPKVSNASYGVAKFQSKEGAERCVRLLDNYPLRPGPIEVRYLYYRDAKEDKLGISVINKDADILKLIREVVAKLSLDVQEPAPPAPAVETLAIVTVEKPAPAPEDKTSTPEATKKSAFTFKYSMAPVTTPTAGAPDTKEEDTKKEMAKSQADKLADYLKKKKTSISERSKSREYRKRSRYSNSRSRSRSRTRSRSWSRSRRRSYSRPRSYSRSYSRSRSRSPGYRGSFRGKYFRGFRGRRGDHFHHRYEHRPPIPRRPRSPPKDKGPVRLKDTYGPSLQGISSDEDFMEEMPRTYEIRIQNIPLFITTKFINDVIMACGSPTPCKKNDRGPGLLAQFLSLKRATMVAQHLNNWRIIDKVLKVEVLADTSEVADKISMVEDTAIAKEIENVFEEYRESFIIKIQGEIMKDPDIFTFKIFKCGVNKCRQYDCHYYHNSFDRRRDHLEFKYGEKMCSNARDNVSCPRGEYCNMSHTMIERIFHPKNYKSNVCLDWYDLKRCPRKGVCAKSHPMNPDSFFSEAWKDVFVAGLDQGFFFFAGAIKLLFKVPDNEGGVPLMFITTLPEIAKLACEVTKPVARIHRLKIAIITDTAQDPGGAHILIGTPSGLANLVESKGSAPLGGLRVLILDDVSTLINNPHHQHHLKFLVRSIYAEVADKKMLCKVALSETCHPSEISRVEELLCTSLSLFNPHKVDTNLLPVLVTTPITAPSAPSPPSVKRPPSPPPKPAEVLSDWESSREEDKTSLSSSRVQKHQKKRSSSSYSRSSSSSRSSSRSSKSSVSKSRSRSRSRSRSKSRGRKRKRSGSSGSDHPKSEYSVFTSEMLGRMKNEETEMFKEHGAAYEVYLEVPEMHPNYEDKYERFLLSYKKKYNTTVESDHMTKMWQKYWKLCIENIKSKDWKRKRKELLEKFKYEARASQGIDRLVARSNNSPAPPSKSRTKESPPTMSSAAVVAAISEISRQRLDNFTVGGALDLLEELSTLIGEIGTNAMSLLSDVRSLGLNTKSAMNLIAKEDNIILLNTVFEKILIQSQRLSGSESDFFKKGIAWGLHLIKYAKEFEESSDGGEVQKVRFDANLFAQQTYNQDPNWIFETLEQSLEYVYGTKPSADIVKQMYANVSAIHHSMSSSTPYLIEGTTASTSFTSSNLGIVSQAPSVDATPTPYSCNVIPLTPLIPTTSTSYSTYSSYPHLSTPLVHSAASGLQMLKGQGNELFATSKVNIGSPAPQPPPLPEEKPTPKPVEPPTSVGGPRMHFYSNPAPPSDNVQPPPPPPPDSPPPPPPPDSAPPPVSVTKISSYPPSIVYSKLPPPLPPGGPDSNPSVVNAILNMAMQNSHLN